MTRVNMGTLDRWISAIITGVIALLLYYGELTDWSAVIAGLLGFCLLISAMTGFCPLYLPFGLNTARGKRRLSA